MKFKNITQSMSAPVSALLASRGGEPPLKKETAELCDRYAKDPSEELKAEILAALTDENKAQLKRFGTELPSDRVMVFLSLGSLFFDVWANNSEIPGSPIGKYSFQKKAQDLAVALQRPTFELEDGVLSDIRDGLSNDTFWPSLAPNAWVDVAGAKVYFPISSKHAEEFFPSVIYGAAKALTEPEEEPEQLPNDGSEFVGA